MCPIRTNRLMVKDYSEQVQDCSTRSSVLYLQDDLQAITTRRITLSFAFRAPFHFIQLRMRHVPVCLQPTGRPDHTLTTYHVLIIMSPLAEHKAASGAPLLHAHSAIHLSHRLISCSITSFHALSSFSRLSFSPPPRTIQANVLPI